MPSNDTENIYSTQYGGEGEPIPAAKISYDNTTSGLTADDIQEAVDELAEVTTKVPNHMLLKPSGSTLLNYSFNVTTDGTKTWGEVLNDLYAEFHTRITALADNARIRPAAIYIQSYGGFLSTYTSGFTNLTVNDTSYYEGARVSAAGVYASNIMIGENSTFVEWLIDGTGATRTIKTTDVPDAGIAVYLNYEVFEKV